MPGHLDPPYDELLATADRVARERPEVDLEMAREVFEEAAYLLHNGLAPDPAAVIRARSRAVLDDPGDLHDPQTVSGSYLVALSVLKL